MRTLDLSKHVGRFIFNTTLGRLTWILSSIVLFLNTMGWWKSVIAFTTEKLLWLGTFLASHFLELPIYFWLILIYGLIWAIQKSRYLSLVAGEFVDDFSGGLGNWEYGGEGWKTETEDGDPLLSVSQSGGGGISTKGFNWSDYEFSFDIKVISKNVGVIVRAENRSKYLMIQLNCENQIKRLRFHLRIPESRTRSFQWMVMQEDDVFGEDISLMKWIKVRVVVLGSNIDIYLNGRHSAHYFVADPIRWKEGYELVKKESGGATTTAPKEDSFVASINYSAGKVGFRCSGDEHAHIRDVKVKPLL